MLASILTPQLVFDGAAYGLVVGLMAMGIVLIYRSTRVINFAVGNLGLVGAALLAVVGVNYHAPFWVAALAAVAVGAVFGVVVELSVIRRLFTAPRVIVLVATIGIAQLAAAVVAAYPEISDSSAPYPTPISADTHIGSVRITGPQLSMLIAAPVLAIAVSWMLNRTLLGKAMKAASDNPELGRLSGINPKVVSTCVWVVASVLATVSMVLVAGANGSSVSLVALGPSTLVRAMAAAVVARLVSIGWAFAAGIAIGVLQNVIQFNFVSSPGLIDFVLLVVVLAVVAMQARTDRHASHRFSFVPRAAPTLDHVARIWWVRSLNSLGIVALGLVGLILPLLTSVPSRHLLYAVVVGFAICALSMTVLTGWAGQLSLGQMAFAGIGALAAAALTRGVSVDIGWRSTRILQGQMPALPFALSIAIAAVITAALATLVGAGALRVQGLFLAVSTFAFAVAAASYLYRRPIFTGGDSRVRFPRGSLFGLSLEPRRTYYFVMLAVLAIIYVVVVRLRRSGVGRTTIAVRDNPDTAAAYTVSTTRTKLRAFALAGGIAGLGGALLAGAVERVPTTDQFFLVEHSLLLVAVVVIGGLGSASGAIVGSIWVIGLPAFFPDNQLVPLFTSSLGLLVLLMYFPGGLVQIAVSVRTAIVNWAAARTPTPLAAPKPSAAQLATRRRVEAPAGDWLRTTDIAVSFGGLRAVNRVSLRVGVGEIVGLIGTNGAGKTTLMNAISGLVPASGRVELLGRDVTDAGAADRARRGLGRTFQAAFLFPELTVRETVQVACEARERTGLLSTALCTPRSIRRERASRAEADELVTFLGLGRYANRAITELSTGTRRIVELAALLALDARMLCLDEPTAGLAQRETEAFGPLIRSIQSQLDASVLIIEHDMPLIMGISDRVYCLEAGAVIAEGPPADVRRDPLVIASYLGTDERAIARSGTVPTVLSEPPVLVQELQP